MDNTDDGHTRAWAPLILVVIVGTAVWLTYASFTGALRSTVPVTVTSDRAGLVLETNAKVKLRGVEVGRVAAVTGGAQPVDLMLEIDSTQIEHIPANVQAQIRATTMFGSKFIDLVYPEHPTPNRLRAGQVLKSRNVATEVNTVLDNVVEVLRRVDVAKLNSTLSALAGGVRDQGELIGQAVTDANTLLVELNSRSETIRADWRSVTAFNDTYAAAAPDLVAILEAAAGTSATLVDRAGQLDALLLATVGMSNSGIGLLAPHQADLINGINVLAPTTELLHKYNPEYTCLLLGAQHISEHNTSTGVDGRTLVLDTSMALGDDPYRYPDNLPIIGAKGGPGGRPGCGSLPVVADNWPVRQLITNTGFGTGMDWRPNPGIGFPGYVNYLPTTRAVPEPPSIRNLFGGPAPGPIPYPGAAPYGADLYAPDGTPLWPGLPPAPPPMAPRDPGPALGAEPFVVPAPVHITPTPLPGAPTP